MIIDVPLVFCGEPRFHRDRSRETAWVYDMLPALIADAEDAGEVVFRVEYPDFEEAVIEWRFLDGQLMRPVLQDFWPIDAMGIENSQGLCPVNDRIDFPAIPDHPSFAASLLETWPEPAGAYLFRANDYERQRSFRHWRWTDRQRRETAILAKLDRYRVFDGLIHKPAWPPTYRVAVDRGAVRTELSSFEWVSENNPAGFHFGHDEADLAHEFARYLSRRLRTPVGEGRGTAFRAFVAAAGHSDVSAGYSVAHMLKSELSNRTNRRTSPAVASVFSAMRTAVERDPGTIADELRRFEALSHEDLNTPRLRGLHLDLGVRRRLLGDPDDGFAIGEVRF